MDNILNSNNVATVLGITTTALSGMFAGGSLYVNVVQMPALRTVQDTLSLRQCWKETFLHGKKYMVTYNYKIKLEKSTGEPLNSHCECPAGKGPHGTCKHVAAVLLMVVEFVNSGKIGIEKSCTENLQTFHKPKNVHTGSPVKAESLPYKRKFSESMFEDPRPFKFRNMDSYNDHVYNTMINYCSTTSMDIAMRYNYGKADIQSAAKDHDYLEHSFLEYWVDQGIMPVLAKSAMATTIITYYFDKSEKRFLLLAGGSSLVITFLWTKFVMMSDILKLLKDDVMMERGDVWVRGAVDSWNRRHFVRSLLGMTSFGIFLYFMSSKK